MSHQLYLQQVDYGNPFVLVLCGVLADGEGKFKGKKAKSARAQKSRFQELRAGLEAAAAR